MARRWVNWAWLDIIYLSNSFFSGSLFKISVFINQLLVSVDNLSVQETMTVNVIIEGTLKEGERKILQVFVVKFQSNQGI